MFDSEEIVRSHRPRAQAISNIVLAAFSLVLARLWYLQVYRGQLLLDFSLKNRLRQEIIKAPRGMIFDNNDNLLVDNIPRFDAVITPQYLQNKEVTLKKLSEILNLPLDNIKKILRKNANHPKYRPIPIKKNISQKEVAILETENADLPGVSVETFISREYKDKEMGSHLLGYISEISQGQLPKLQGRKDGGNYRLGDFIGQFGIEEQFDDYLRGQDGHEFVEVDALGRKNRHIGEDNIFKGVKNKSSIPGNNLRLTIDGDLQKSAYMALEGKVGAIVMMEVNTGKVLSMVSTPSFDPSQFGRGVSSEYWSSLINNPERPLRDRTIQEHYPPGSIFKAVMAIAALEEGVIDEHTEINCNGGFKLGKRVFHCHKKGGHGTVDVYKSLRESCDVFYFKVAMKMDVDTFAKYANILGLGKPTGILLPREVPGLIPTKAWKKKRYHEDWQMGDSITCAIGQSYMLASPLQLSLAFSAIANGGKVYRPYVVEKIFNNAGEVLLKSSPELVSEYQFKEKTLKIVREALHQVMNMPSGTVYSRRVPGLDMMGKTGTAQVIRISADKIYNKCIELEYRFRHHGLFIGYGPATDPKVVVMGIVEHGCSGSGGASPVVQKVMETYMKKYMPDVYAKNLEEDKKGAQRYMIALQKKKEEAEAAEKKASGASLEDDAAPTTESNSEVIEEVKNDLEE